VSQRTWILATVAAIAIAIATGLWLRSSRVAPASGSALSIAVLPFTDMSERHDQGHFSDGIAEEILNRLAQSEDLRVIARTSSFALGGEALDVMEIARKLGVTHMLEGSVRKSGDRIRVTAQLVAGSDGAHVWSRTYERRLDDMFAIQDEIASSVATALRITLVSARSMSSSPISFEAYESFLQGDHMYYRREPGDVERSVGYFKRAIALEPEFARAWAGLAAAYGHLSWEGPEQDLELRRLHGEAARRAVALEPDLAVAQVRLAGYLEEINEIEESDKHFRIAAELDPEEPLVLNQSVDNALERDNFDKAIEIQRRIVLRDPLNRVARQNLALFLMVDGRLDEAMKEYRGVLDLSPEAGPDIEVELVRIDVLKGLDAEAHAGAMRLPEGRFRDHGLALLYRSPEFRAESDAALERLTRIPSEGTTNVGEDIMNHVRLAETQAFRGMIDAAFATLRQKQAVLVHKWGQGSNVAWYFGREATLSPFLKPLHADPRWKDFLEASG
jgi:TolB-like protein